MGQAQPLGRREGCRASVGTPSVAPRLGSYTLQAGFAMGNRRLPSAWGMKTRILWPAHRASPPGPGNADSTACIAIAQAREPFLAFSHIQGMHSFCGCLVWGLISIQLSYHLHFPSSHRLCYNRKNESIYRARLQNESINPEQNQGQIPSSVVAAGVPKCPGRRLARASWKPKSCSRHQ